MLFNSFSFIFFLAIVFPLYWLFFSRNIKVRNAFILFVSYCFYCCWNWKLLSLIIFISLVDFFAGYGIYKLPQRNRKVLLSVAIACNVGVLCFFKYFNFFLDSFSRLANMFNYDCVYTPLDIILPIGISFYTFQGLSYVIDIYRQKIEPTNDIVGFCAFIAFFPQLVAGPIERAKNLLPQFFQDKQFNYDQIRSGLFLIAVGLFRKIVIADRIAIYVDSVYGNLANVQGFCVLLAIVLFAFQLYIDFSAYSQIAIGTARLFGFNLSTNFNKPYLATSFGDFWSRWHITLTSWFKDYVYIPLGGNRNGVLRTYRNIMIIFLVSGLWHGANWNFIIWGAINGIFLIIFDKVLHFSPTHTITKIIGCLWVLLVWTFSLVFFRTSSFTDAITAFSHCGFNNFEAIYEQGLSIAELKLVLILLITEMGIDLLVEKKQELVSNLFFNRFFFIRWSMYFFLILSTIFLGIYGIGNDNTFIYFQF